VGFVGGGLTRTLFGGEKELGRISREGFQKGGDLLVMTGPGGKIHITNAAYFVFEEWGGNYGTSKLVP
jgi:hypothetical protein